MRLLLSSTTNSLSCRTAVTRRRLAGTRPQSPVGRRSVGSQAYQSPARFLFCCSIENSPGSGHRKPNARLCLPYGWGWQRARDGATVTSTNPMTTVCCQTRDRGFVFFDKRRVPDRRWRPASDQQNPRWPATSRQLMAHRRPQMQCRGAGVGVAG
jgi:hypothetical protein